jgi:hypothetical protein
LLCGLCLCPWVLSECISEGAVVPLVNTPWGCRARSLLPAFCASSSTKPHTRTWSQGGLLAASCVAPAGSADKVCHVWGLQGLTTGGGGSSSSGTACSTTAQLSQQLLASQRRRASVGAAMAFDPMVEVLCAGHSDGIVSVWNCCHSPHCSTYVD